MEANIMMTEDAIQYVKNMSSILSRDNNAITAWELHCSRDYDKLCLGIFAFMNANDNQISEAMSLLSTKLDESKPEVSRQAQ